MKNFIDGAFDEIVGIAKGLFVVFILFWLGAFFYCFTDVKDIKRCFMWLIAFLVLCFIVKGIEFFGWFGK